MTNPILETVNMFYMGMVNFSNKKTQCPLSGAKIMEDLLKSVCVTSRNDAIETPVESCLF